MADFLADTTDLLRRTPVYLRVLLAGLPDAWTDTPDVDGGWRPRDVVGHLITAEATDWMTRTHLILEHGTAVPFEPLRSGGDAGPGPRRAARRTARPLRRAPRRQPRRAGFAGRRRTTWNGGAATRRSARSPCASCSPHGPSTTSITSARSTPGWRASYDGDGRAVEGLPRESCCAATIRQRSPAEGPPPRRAPRRRGSLPRPPPRG